MDVDSAPAPVEKTYDVCIIGAGPAGLSVLSALQNPEGILSSEAQWSQWKKAKEGGSGRELPSVCVIDPAGWLSEWRGRFRSLGIKMLRSPAWATPDFFSTNAMCSLHTFAWEAGRQAELHELELPRKAKHLNRVAGTGMFQLPGSRLFEDFCDEWVTKAMYHIRVLRPTRRPQSMTYMKNEKLYCGNYEIGKYENTKNNLKTCFKHHWPFFK